MESSLLHKAADFMLARRRRKRWQKIVSGMASVVVFCTTYALILPAITMSDDVVCGLEEHAHTEACWTTQTIYPQSAMACTFAAEGAVAHEHDSLCRSEDGTLICTLESLAPHQHADSCYGEEKTLACTETEELGHTHSDACYTSVRGDMICTQAEDAGHSHGETCYQVSSELTCTDESEEHAHEAGCYTESELLVCLEEERPGHTHDDSCYSWIREQTCTQEERPAGHIHGESCYQTETVLTCGLEETVAAHQHTQECIIPAQGEPWEEQVLTCGLEVHSHGESCYPDESEDMAALSEEEQLRVDKVISLIDALPTGDEIDAALLEYENAEDWEGYEAYFLDVAERAKFVYAHYQELPETKKALVENAEELLTLEWLWSARTLEVTDSVFVSQVNAYSKTTPILVCGDKVGNVLSDAFSYWVAIIVEEDELGQLYVDQIFPSGEGLSKREYKADAENGFVLLIWEGDSYYPPTMQVGDLVESNFQYKNVSGYRETGYGYISFRSTNDSELDTVRGADTNELIEVNLYDYSYVNDSYQINANYNANENLPGFQQDDGEKTVSNIGSSNFGNNITTDLAAGLPSITLRDNGIHINGVTNKVTGSDVDYGYANVPVSGAMYPRLLEKDGVLYPALADKTSLFWLWQDNGTYVRKQNTNSINGLFQKDEESGSYHFNSRENHAQFNAENNTFTLYKQVISSNYAWYPFGNFLPFNDITTQAKQASQIDRDYLEQIANRAYAKYQNGYGEEYNTLYTAMTAWIAKMDAAYGSNWTSYNATNAYFGTMGPGKDDPNFVIPGLEEVLENVYSIDFDEPTNFFFGMDMKMTFMQPKGGMTGNDNNGDGKSDYPMEFYFTGDDDVWVYIDGVLFLDLSGIHRHVGGEIDFVNGLVNYYVLDPATGDVSGTPYRTDTFAEILQAAGASTADLNSAGTFKDYSSHTFNFYYMERGAGSGVCRMNFNFPLLRQNSISVSKALSTEDETRSGVLGNLDYRFQVLKADADGNKTTELFIGPSTEYTLYDANDKAIGTRTTDAHGVFTMKAGQRAEFAGINEDAGKYYVRELLDEVQLPQYGEITVSGQSTTITETNVTVGSDTFTGVDSPVKDMSDGATVFSFNNQITVAKLGKLAIEKKVDSYVAPMALDPPTFTMDVTLDGIPIPVGTSYEVLNTEGEKIRESTVDTAGQITITPGERAVISDILAGTQFRVTEAADSAAGYTVGYQVNGGNANGTAAEGVIQIYQSEADTVQVLVTNSEGGCYADLPIRKELLNADSVQRTFSFKVEQANPDGTDYTVLDPDFEITMDPDRGEQSETFRFAYIERELGGLPVTYTYRITENTGDPGIVYDPSEYLVTVTVSRGDNGLTAEITDITKDGQPVDSVVFRNEVIHYTLPETGGGGTGWYTLAGTLLMMGAALLLYKDILRRKEDSLSTS